MLRKSIRRSNGTGTFAGHSGGLDFGFGSAAAARDAAQQAAETAKLPNRHTYETMSDEELQTLIQTKDRQIGELRHIYEHFHYEVDKRFRTMVLDYHDKALAMSKVHGDMQSASLTINREALMQMRLRDEMRNRDRRLIQVLCFGTTLAFWYWLRRHYVFAKQDIDPTMSRSSCEFGSGGENIMSSAKRSARSWDTPYEKEIREQGGYGNKKTLGTIPKDA